MQQKIIVMMGVCGVGKTSIAQAIAQEVNGRYVEADDFHPDGNISAMRSGNPLTDQMRRPWLEGLAEAMAKHQQQGPEQPVIAACSSLKKSYRDIIRTRLPEAYFVFLHSDRDLIRERMKARQDHFMPLTLLDSQLETLEPPLPTEAFGAIDVKGTKAETIEKVLLLLTREDQRA